MFILDFFKQNNKIENKDVSNKTLLYKGAYKYGHATYEYVNSKYFRIFNGKFSYKYTYQTRTKTKGEEIVAGNYTNNKKTGLWEYKCHEKNMKRNLKVEYIDGIQSGVYEYCRKGGFYEFEHDDNETYISTVMKNGRPVGKLKAFICNSMVVGECDLSGYPDGTWYMDMANDKKHLVCYEIWNHGLLDEYYYIDTTTGNRYDEKMDIFVKIECFIKYECYPIESIIKKGSTRWHGDIISR